MQLLMNLRLLSKVLDNLSCSCCAKLLVLSDGRQKQTFFAEPSDTSDSQAEPVVDLTWNFDNRLQCEHSFCGLYTFLYT